MEQKINNIFFRLKKNVRDQHVILEMEVLLLVIILLVQNVVINGVGYVGKLGKLTVVTIINAMGSIQKKAKIKKN